MNFKDKFLVKVEVVNTFGFDILNHYMCAIFLFFHSDMWDRIKFSMKHL